MILMSLLNKKKRRESFINCLKKAFAKQLKEKHSHQ